MSLADLVTLSDSLYSKVKTICTDGAKVTHFFYILDKSRDLIKVKAPGCNIIIYFLQNMNNKIMRLQYNSETCDKLSHLHLCWGCIPFDQMPYASSLIKHNPRINDLFECISPDNREHEFLARTIRNNTEQNGILFTPSSDLERFKDIDALINTYNSHLYYKHANRRIEVYKEHLYIKGYVVETSEIIQGLKDLSSEGRTDYKGFIELWLSMHNSYIIDSSEKLNTIKELFLNSHVALIYGSAGTGKSTIINHISNIYNDCNKVFLANTNPAVDNLRRKVTADNCYFKTITQFLSNNQSHKNCDILFIDECSTVSNKDMRDILEKASFELLVLVGDIFQIESILFGNWFSIARSFVPETSISELSKPYRCENMQLLDIWDNVRNLNDNILELLVKGGHSVDLDRFDFEQAISEEIVLCVNYDGLYGINNVNRFMQNSNPNSEVVWGFNTYKIGDPILFNETNRFAPYVYNNMKGRIRDIELASYKIRFEVELDVSLTNCDVRNCDFMIVGTSVNGNSVISFWVDKYQSTDDDHYSSNAVVPFQVAYAVSIHKAQGLEYESVKIVITNEAGESVNHNVFYTAITRAKKDFKIYWTPETEKKVLEGLSLRDYNKDASLLASLKNLK